MDGVSLYQLYAEELARRGVSVDLFSTLDDDEALTWHAIAARLLPVTWDEGADPNGHQIDAGGRTYVLRDPAQEPVAAGKIVANTDKEHGIGGIQVVLWNEDAPPIAVGDKVYVTKGAA